MCSQPLMQRPLLAPPESSQKYQALKDFLIRTYSPSHWECTKRILAVTDLGDRKPSAHANQLLTWLREFSLDILLQQVSLGWVPYLHMYRMLLLAATSLTWRA